MCRATCASALIINNDKRLPFLFADFLDLHSPRRRLDEQNIDETGLVPAK